MKKKSNTVGEEKKKPHFCINPEAVPGHSQAVTHSRLIITLPNAEPAL